MKRSSLVLAIVAAILATACGGSSGTHVTTPADSVFAAGNLVGRAAATNPPVTTTSSAVAATGMKGTFSLLKLRELEPTLDETRLLFNSNYQGFAQLYSMAPDGSDLTKIVSIPGGAILEVDASAQGKIAYTAFVGGNYDIYVANPDGTSQTLVTPNPTEDSTPRWSPDGTRIAFVSHRSGAINIFLVNVATLGVTQVTGYTAGGPLIYDLAFSRDGSTLYYNIGTSILRIPTAGGSPTTVRGGSTTYQHIAMSPDGSELAISQVDTGAYSIIRLGLGTGAEVHVPLDGSVEGLAYSPDSQKILFSMDQTPYMANLFVLDKVTGSFEQVTHNLGYNLSVSWTYPVKDRTLIAGGGGILGTSAAGVIYAQQGAGTKSVVTFDATTPSSVVITAQTGLGTSTPNLIFSVDADNIPKMAFANGTGWRGTRIVGTGTPVLSANGALVSIDGITGRVVSILPFSGSRSARSKPSVVAEGGKETFRGNFIAAYDASGHNVAPGGATKVTYDGASHTLTAG